MTSPPALSLVAGLSAQAPARAIARWLADRPVRERWAVLADAGARPVVRQGEAVGFFELPAVCPCCAGALALRSAFARVQRAGPWQRIFLLLPAAAHAATSVDALRAGLAACAPRLEAVVALVDARRPAPWLDPAAPGSEAARALAEIATLVVVDGESAAQRAPLASRLAEGPLGARPVVQADAAMPGWEVVHAAAGAAPRPGVVCWPPEAVFHRTSLRSALAGLRAREPGLPMRGVFRTARDWYRWNPDDPQPWVTTHWRLDSRFECALTDVENLERMTSSLAAALAGAGSAPG